MTDQPERSLSQNAARVAGRRCPICGKQSVAETRPFCSRRCADVDLSRWFGGAYRIPVDPAGDEDADGHLPDQIDPEGSAE